MKRRPMVRLQESLEHRLTAYALAASASGMGLLLCSQPAVARIVYTKAHKQLQPNEPLNLDLNHDGIVDFTLNFPAFTDGFSISVTGKRANQVAGYCRSLSQDCWASAQLPDVRVGPNERFGPYRGMFTGYGRGPWNNVQDRYLGFEFSIKGKIHYGWARLNVDFQNQEGAVLTGYAYETIPKKPIITGKTKGPDVITVQPGTLGHRAAGSAGRSGE